MMKSFFKKLAFVMALAMVVSAMAPAATAKAAEAGLLRQESTTWETIKTDELTEGDEQDYKFAYAPTNWKSLGLKWTSSDEAVATVDEVTGLVKAVKAGTTTIKVAGGTYEASLVLTVKAKEVVKTFDAKQTTATNIVLTFADADTAKAAAANVTVTKKITTLVGVNYMPWVLDEANTKVDGNKVTIQPWVPFGTATYEIDVEGFETFTIDTAVGAPAEAYLSYAKPYIYADTDNKGAAATLKVTDAKGVEVKDYTTYYEIVKSEPSGYASINSTDGTLYLYNNPTKATVKVTVRYNDANGQPQSFVRTLDVESSRKPVVTVNEYLEKVAVVSTAAVTADADATDKVANAKAKADKIDWTAQGVKIADGTYQVVGLIKKSDDSSYSINKWSVGTADATKNQLDNCDAPVNYKFEYSSTDTTKVIVDKTNGTFVGVNTTEKPVHILVTMFKYNTTTYKWQEVGIVAAVPVVVDPAKAAQRVVLDVPSKVLLTDGVNTTVKVTPTTYDQYGGKVTTDVVVSVKATFNNITHELDIPEAGVKDFTIDAKDVHEVFNKDAAVAQSNFAYKVTMKSGKSEYFNLTLKIVDDNNKQNKDYKLDVKGAEIKHDKLDDQAKISVATTVLGEKYDNAPFYYGKVDVSKAKENDLYVVVYDQDRNVITPATTTSLYVTKTFDAVTKNVAGSKIETLKAQTYTVQLYKVTGVVDGPNKEKIILDQPVGAPVTYTVTNNLPQIATDIKANLKTTVNVLSVDANGKATVLLNKGAVTYKINGEANDCESTGNFTISSVNAVSVGASDKVFVYSFTVQYKIGNGFVEIVVPVNQTFDKQK